MTHQCSIINAESSALIKGDFFNDINNYIHYKVWDEIIYPFLIFNGATV